MRKAVKTLLSNNLFLPIRASRRFIFVYHDISNEKELHFSAKNYSTTVENFRKQIKYLSHIFEMVSLDKLVTDKSLDVKKHYASIVFDDGFSSVMENASPILKSYKIPFSIFVNKSAVIHNQSWISNLIINKDDEKYLNKIYQHSINQKISFSEFAANPIESVLRFQNFDKDFRRYYLREDDVYAKKIYLDANDVRQLHAEGVIVGSHSTDHYMLTKCSSEELHTQINENEVYLENLLNSKIKHFAIPFGKNNSYNSKTTDAIFASGSKFVYTTNVVPFKSKNLKSNKFLFPRVGVLNQQPSELMFYINRTFLKNYNL